MRSALIFPQCLPSLSRLPRLRLAMMELNDSQRRQLMKGADETPTLTKLTGYFTTQATTVGKNLPMSLSYKQFQYLVPILLL